MTTKYPFFACLTSFGAGAAAWILPFWRSVYVGDNGEPNLLFTGLLLFVDGLALLSFLLGFVLLLSSIILQPPGTKSPALLYGSIFLAPSLFLILRFASALHR